MYNRVFKNSQINITSPYKINNHIYATKNGEGKNFSEGEQEDEYENAQQKAKEIMDRANEEAELIIREAHLEAERIISEANEKANESREIAHKQGYEEGFLQGETKGKSDCECLLKEAEELKEKSIHDYKETLLEAQNEIASLSIAIGRKVINEELKINPDVVISLVREVLSKTLEKKGITLEVSSDDYEVVSKNIDVIATKEFGISEIELKENPGLSKGDVLAKTDFGTINGSIDSKIEKVNEAFNQLSGEEDEE